MDRLVLLDSNSLINRAYYALPNLTNREGQHTGAIFGYLNMLLKLIDQYRPTHIVATFDRKAPTFRKQMYDLYKATRKGMPDELASQLEPLKEILRAMRLPIVETDGYEADDLIGTIAKRSPMPAYIVTGDRDSLQLIDDNVTVLLTRKGITEIDEYTPDRLAQDGLRPSQIIDLKSLMGDASDNIPGVGGVGEKTAKDLLARYDTLDGVYAHLDEIKGKLREKLENDRDQAYLSYELATICLQAPVQLDWDACRLRTPFDPTVDALLRKLELGKLSARMPIDSSAPAVESVAGAQTEHVALEDAQAVAAFVQKAKERGAFALVLDKQIRMCCDADCEYEAPIRQNLLDDGIDYDELLALLRPLLEDAGVTKYLFDVKSYMHLLAPYGIAIAPPYEDVLLGAYLCDANRTFRTIEDLLAAYTQDETAPATGLLRIWDTVRSDMERMELQTLYREIELPLVPVLYDMETRGFCVDTQAMRELNERFTAELGEITDVITQLAGKAFNLNSTKQLAQVLFEDLRLQGGKKTKTGYSTNVEVLQSLKGQHPIIEPILRYRELSKLKSTYLDGMQPLIDAHGAIHTIFKQAVTATGRLSSTEPNLQNIPVRKEEGRQIRKMFIPSAGNRLVIADYSQIELRLMAAFSKDPSMIRAFREGRDIHAQTAAQVFGVPIERVTHAMRGQAKAVNFGIIYGISDFGLAEDLGIPVWKARDFIARYFETYPHIKTYLDACVEQAKANGYVTTLCKRRRAIPELQSPKYAMRTFGERVAMNMPLQGSASDIVKLAMIAVADGIRAQGLQAKLIMQVHDELIVDTPPQEVEQVRALLKQRMEQVVALDVPLIADVGVGDNWLEAKE